MPYTAVLDTDVLFGSLPCDLLLTLAERGLYRAVWSEEILAELQRNLNDRVGALASANRVQVMRDFFPEAMCPSVQRYLGSVPEGVDEKDRHVVAAAIAAKADGIVTRNLRDFPNIPLAELGLDVQSLDHFLVNQWHLDDEATWACLTEMTERYRRPPLSIAEIAERLAPIAGEFAALVIERVARL